MTIVSQPKVTVNKLPADLPAPFDPQKILVINQKTPSGTIVPGVLTQNVAQSQVDGLAGKGSQLQNALLALFDTLQRTGSIGLPQVDVIALDDAGGATPAEGVITVSEDGGATNAATVDGTVEVIIASENLFKIELPISIGQGIISGAGNISDALADAINAFEDIPVAAANVAGVITLTARNGGSVGNGITMRIRGLSLNSGANVLGNVEFALTGFTGGATNPDVSTILSVVGTERYQTITHPIEYGTAFSVDNFLDNRFNVDDDILDGVAVIKKTDTFSNLETLLDAENSESLVFLCDLIQTDDLFKGATIIELDYVISARFSALRAVRRTEGANINRITPAATSGAQDASGGAHISSLPYFNTPMQGVEPIEVGKGFNRTEIEDLFNKGGTIVGNNTVGNAIILGEAVTTYKTDSSANPDATWKFLNTVDTMSSSAEFIFNNLKTDFAQSRLTEGDLVAGFAIVNEEAFRTQMKKYYLDLSSLVLVPKGDASVNFFTNNLTVLLDLLKGKITSSAKLPIVVQLRDILVNLRTVFSINA